MLYFIQSGNRIKIGRATQPLIRFRQIHTASPEKCRLLLSIVTLDDAEAERKLHGHFSDHRTNGEWFEINFKTALKALLDLNLIAEHDEPTLEIPYPQQLEPEPMDPQFEEWFFATRPDGWTDKDRECAKSNLLEHWDRERKVFLQLRAKSGDLQSMIKWGKPMTNQEAAGFIAALRKQSLDGNDP